MLWVATLPAVVAGFVQVRVPDPNGPPLGAGIWYPSEASSSARGLGLYTQTVAVGGCRTAREKGVQLSGPRLPSFMTLVSPQR